MSLAMQSLVTGSSVAPQRSLPQQAIDGKLNSSAGNASARAQERANPNSAVAHVARQQAVELAESQAANEPQNLLQRSLTEGLSEALTPALGDAAALELPAGDDYSPQALADRIAAAATGLFDAFSQSPPERDAATTLSDFMVNLRAGLDAGFAEAREVLTGLDALNEEAAAGIDETQALLEQALTAFEDGVTSESAYS